MIILSIVRDLIFSSKLRAAAEGAGHQVVSVRALDQISLAASNPEARIAVIDLGCTVFDPFAAIAQLQEIAPNIKLIAFYSHVEVELAAKAQAIPGLELYTRSQFTGELSQIVARAV